MKVSIFGSGYVGLITGIGLAKKGHKVILVDVDKKKVQKINKGIMPIYEEGVSKKDLKGIKATINPQEAVINTDISFICVGTPSMPNGMMNLNYVKKSAEAIAKALVVKNDYHVIAVKSTVMPGTTKNIVLPILKKHADNFGLCMNPEFLREGKALTDFLKPDRIVIGCLDKKAGSILKKLYSKFKAPIVITDLTSAEMVKVASNSFLATKISFINEIANICEKFGIDVEEVVKGVKLDHRISPHFLQAGAGFGGSCFPKDVKGLIDVAKKKKYIPNLLSTVMSVNEKQALRVLNFTGPVKGRKILVLGTAFKAGTDDIRESASIRLIHELIKKKAKTTVYDPQAMQNAKKVFGNKIKYAKSMKSGLKNQDLIIIMTEWPEFKKIKDLTNKPIILGRRILKPDGINIKAIGYT